MGAYTNFINSMLELREQKLKEEELKQKQEQAMMEQALQVSKSIGSSLVSAQSKSATNAAANQLANQYFAPRAQAVDPTIQASADKVAAGMPDMFTGGKEQLDMLMQLEKQKTAGMDAIIKQKQAQQRIDISGAQAGTAAGNLLVNQDQEARLAATAAENAKRAQSQKIVDDFKYASEQATDKYKGYEKDAAAFNKASALALDGVKNATNQQQYIDALGVLESHYKAAEATGLKVQKPQIASWEELQAAKAKQAAIDQAAAYEPGFWTGAVPGLGSTLQQQSLERSEQMQKELQGMPGYSRDPARLEPENYLAVPAMERPATRDIAEVRREAEASVGLAPTGQVAPPVSGATAGGGGKGEQTISLDEAKSLGIPNPVPGKVYEETDANGRGTGKYFRIR